MINFIDVLPFFVAGLSVLTTSYKLYKARNLSEVIFTQLTTKMPGLEKIVSSAKIARISIKLGKYIKTDLSDGRLDDLELLDKFLDAVKVRREELKKWLN